MLVIINDETPGVDTIEETCLYESMLVVIVSIVTIPRSLLEAPSMDILLLMETEHPLALRLSCRYQTETTAPILQMMTDNIPLI